MAAKNYAKVTKGALKELGEIVGKQYVITDVEKLEPYSHDEIPGKDYRCMPDVLVRPKTPQQVSEIVKLANRRRIPITPRGAGSGLSGGAVPVFHGIVLSTERMNRILEIDEKNMMIAVEPGVITNDINDKIKDKGLFYAGYPMSVETCSIGGNIAENAGGGKAIKYGVTERYVLGLEVVTPAGDIIRIGGKRVKDVTGYNLVKLMIGSEGTLGIVTRIILRLMPLPKSAVALLVLFSDTESAIGVVPKIMTAGGVIPTSIEYMDQLSIRITCEYLNEHLPYQEAGAMLLIEVDGNDEETVRRNYETVGELCLANKAQEVYVADNHTTRERLWGVRRNIPDAFNNYSAYVSHEDIVVPPAAIPELIPELHKIERKYNVEIGCFGHAGDGNLHPQIIKDPDESAEGWKEKLEDILVQFYEMTKKLGGTLSGEHGIGSKRKRFMHIFASEGELELIRQIKRALDPNNIMNPGKIVDV